MKNLLIPVYSILACCLFLNGCADGENMDGLPKTSLNEPIRHTLHDPHHDPQQVVGDLLRLVYDIPYFAACGVFPPQHLANQWFSHGGGDAGMSPGASWKPFEITRSTYLELRAAVSKFDPADFEDSAEVFRMRFVFDDSFDYVGDRFEWAKLVCDKHRTDFFERQNLKLQQDGWINNQI